MGLLTALIACIADDCFAVWEIFSKEGEVAQGRNIADACKDAGVEQFIWSSLAHASKGKNVHYLVYDILLIDLIVSEGKLAHMVHLDSKAEVEEYTRSLGIPATFFYAGAYMSNIPSALQKVRWSI